MEIETNRGGEQRVDPTISVSGTAGGLLKLFRTPVGTGEVLESKDPGVVLWQALLWVPGARPEALEAPVLVEPAAMASETARQSQGSPKSSWDLWDAFCVSFPPFLGDVQRSLVQIPPSTSCTTPKRPSWDSPVVMQFHHLLVLSTIANPSSPLHGSFSTAEDDQAQAHCNDCGIDPVTGTYGHSLLEAFRARNPSK